MRKLALFLSLLLLLSCSHKNDIVIKGNLDNGNGRMLYLSILTADGLSPFDSVVVRRNAFCFSISPKNIEQIMGSDDPVFFQLSVSAENALTTLARKGDTVRIKADANQLVSTYLAEGAEDALLMWQLDSALSKFVQYADTLLQIYQYYMDDDSARSWVEWHHNRAVEKHQQYLRNFILVHPQSFSTMIAFYQGYNNLRFFDEKKDANLLRSLTDSLAKYYPNSQYVRYLQSRTR